MPFRTRKFLPTFRVNEKIYLILRQHWIVPGLKILYWLVFVLAVLFLDGLAKAWLAEVITGQVAAVISVIRGMLLITAMLGTFMVWTLYYLNTQIITNERIVDISQKSLLNHSTSELDLEKVQDVKAEIKGVLANIFDYGNVLVQTAGEEANFAFENIANPHEVAKLVLKLYDQAPKHHGPK